MKESCNICEIVARPSYLIFETDCWLIMLAKDQEYLGRTYVTLKKHKGRLSELDDEEWHEYSEIVKVMERAWSKSLLATNFNWSCLMNDAFHEDLAKPHVHWHFRPRYSKKQKINDVLFADSNFGHHYNREQRSYVDEDTLLAIIDKIRKELPSLDQ